MIAQRVSNTNYTRKQNQKYDLHINIPGKRSRIEIFKCISRRISSSDIYNRLHNAWHRKLICTQVILALNLIKFWLLVGGRLSNFLENIQRLDQLISKTEFLPKFYLNFHQYVKAIAIYMANNVLYLRKRAYLFIPPRIL